MGFYINRLAGHVEHADFAFCPARRRFFLAATRASTSGCSLGRSLARRYWIGAGVIALGLAAASTRLLGSRTAPRTVFPPLPYHRGKITVSLVPAGGLTNAELAEGAGGDYLLQNGRLAFVIGADVLGIERQARYGVLLDVSLDDFRVDELFDLRPVVRVEGKLVTLAVTQVSLVRDGRFPFLRVDQHAADGSLSLQTDYLAAPDSNRLRLSSRCRNLGNANLRSVEIGERTRWPGAPTFVPRLGFPKDVLHAELSWLARQGSRLTYALAFPGGQVQAAFFYDHVAQVGQETSAPVGDLAVQTEASYERDLIVVEGDLGAAAERVLQALDRPAGFVEGKLSPQPAWAVVEALYPDGKPALSVRANEGRFRLPLPPGDYRIVAHAPGGDDSADVHVRAGETLDVPLFAPMPGRLEFLATDGEGADIAVRVIVRGIPPTKDPELGPAEQQGSRIHNVMYARHGVGELELPEGRYRVVITHGPEYELFEREVEVNPKAGVMLRAVLQHTVQTRGWLGCDFHLHAAPSLDSSVTLDDRVLSLLAEGVEFAVPTDHNHVTDYARAIQDHGATPLLGTTPGVEVTTPSWGHFNAYPYPPHAPAPPFSAVTPVEIFSAIRARAPGAVIQVNHPRMPGVGYFNRIELDPQTGIAAAEGASFEFDAVEVVNGYDLESSELIQSNLQEWFALLNAGRRLTATGNSDSHRLIINWAGYPRTYIRVRDDEHPERVTPAEVARAVTEGRVVVANGIFLAVLANGTAGPGDTVMGRRVTLEVDARAPSWVDLSSIEVWVNGNLAHSSPRALKPTPGGRLLWQTELDLPQDSWIAAVARGREPMSRAFLGRRVLPFGFSNPVYVDADEDGEFTAPEAPPTARPPTAAKSIAP